MRLFSSILILVLFGSAHAQIYVLKDSSQLYPDTQQLYTSLPEMCDSFYATFISNDMTGFKKFTPRVKYLKETFDTLAIEYREEQVLYRQQMLLRNLQRSYKKITKYTEKNKIKLNKIENSGTDYRYGEDEQKNRYCYITVYCTRKKHEYELKYLAIQLNGHWFVGDELSFSKL